MHCRDECGNPIIHTFIHNQYIPTYYIIHPVAYNDITRCLVCIKSSIDIFKNIIISIVFVPTAVKYFAHLYTPLSNNGSVYYTTVTYTLPVTIYIYIYIGLSVISIPRKINFLGEEGTNDPPKYYSIVSTRSQFNSF